MRYLPHEIVKTLLDSVDYAEPVLAFSILPGGETEILVSDTAHLRDGLYVNVDGTDYEAKNVGGGVFTVSSALNNPKTAVLPPPAWAHGTPIAVNAEIGNRPEINRAPLVWLYEIAKDKVNFAEFSPVERYLTLSLFFLDNADVAWDTDGHYAGAIDRMQSLAEMFEACILSSQIVAQEEIGSIEYYHHADFGKYITERGHVSRIFADNFSGVEMRLTLPIKKSVNCS